jgi:hypothetical protein
MLNFTNINIFAVLVSTIICFVIGGAWYAALFAKPYEKEAGLTPEQLKNPNYLKTYGGSFVLMFIMMLGLASIIKGLGISGTSEWLEGAKTGFLVGLTLVISGLGINYLYQYKSLKLFLIDGGYQTLFLTIGAIILTVWS